MHLVDHARAHIEKTYKRPFMNRLTRSLLAAVLPYPGRFRLALHLARLGRPFAGLMRGAALKPFAAMLALAPRRLPAASDLAKPGTYRSETERRGRVAILSGCAQPVLDPGINAAAIRLLTRLGIEVVAPEGEVCCGSLVHHMGRAEQALQSARANVDVWTREIEGQGLDAIIITASGCGTTIKDYGHMLRSTPPMPQRRPGSRRWQRTSPNIWRPSNCRPICRGALRSPIIPPARCSTASASRLRRNHC